MNKILVVTSFVFVSFLSCTGLTEKQRLADQILSDTALHKVDSMARATIRSGFNAGSGYSQIWARDMNTFIEIACEESDPHELREAILLFFALQQPNDEMIDGYVLKEDFTWYDDTPYYSNAAPKHVAFKNTVETDQMPGYSAVPIIADAYLKGFTGFDADRAYRYMVASSVYEKQNGVPYVLEKGYIPCDKVREATSIAMEYAADDWGIALMAKKMGKTEDYQNYLKRGKYYTQYFDKDINFIRPKMNDGSWRTPYDPIQSIHSVGDFCEGNGWHYTFFVPQHPEGLIELMGGDAPFISKLDSLFLVEGELGENASPDISGLIGMYAHGNEPSHHVTYLYPYAGEQWKTAEKVRYIQDVFYTDQPEGIIGNEDCGQMSAWHIMSALGFYQVNPSNGVFVFGSPLFDKASVHLPEGKTFEVVAQNNSKENVYIQSVLLNGKPYNNSYILYDDIVKGGNLTFVMGNTPNKEFGAAPENRPKTAE